MEEDEELGPELVPDPEFRDPGAWTLGNNVRFFNPPLEGRIGDSGTGG